MKRFLVHIGVFLAIMLVILGVAEVVVRHYPNSYQYKKAWMDQNAECVQTLVLGGSHTYYAVEPDILSGCAFSLANVSQSPEYDYWLLSHYIDRCKSLKAVIMVADEANFFDAPMEDVDIEWYRCRYYKIYMDYPKHSWLSKYNLEMTDVSTFSRKLVPALKYLFTGQYTLDCDSLGFGSSFVTPERFDSAYMESMAKATAERHRCDDWSQVARNKADAFKVAELCQKKGIRLILVTPPMWSGFVKLVSQRQLDVMHGIIKEMQEKYGALYGDYLTDPRFEGVDFHDPDHLSLQGAEKFTKILKQDFGL